MHGNALLVPAQSGLSAVEMALVSFLVVVLLLALALTALSPVLEGFF